MWVNVRWGTNDWESYSHHAFNWKGGRTRPRLISISDMCCTAGIDSIENYRLTVELSDHDGYFAKRLETTSLQGARIGVRDTKFAIFVGWITNSPVPRENRLTIKADTFSFLNKPANKMITSEEFENCDPANGGKYGNYIFRSDGAVGGPRFTAYLVDTETFIAAWNPVKVIYCFNVDDELLSFTYEVGENGYTYIHVSTDDSYIYFFCSGPGISDNTIDNPIVWINDYFNYYQDEFERFTIKDLNESIDIYESRGYKNNCLHITSDETIKDVFECFEKSFGCKIVINRDNTISFRTQVWGSEAGKMRIFPPIIKDFKKYLDTVEIKKYYARTYSYNPLTKSYDAEFTDIVSDSPYASDGVMEIKQKYVYTDIDSFNIALRQSFTVREPLKCYKFKIPPSYAYGLEPGMTIDVKHKNSYYPDEYRVVQVLRINQSNELGWVTIEGYDVSAIQQKSPKLYASGDSRNPILYASGDSRNPVLFFTN